jgi:hypothetical protein
VRTVRPYANANGNSKLGGSEIILKFHAGVLTPEKGAVTILKQSGSPQQKRDSQHERLAVKLVCAANVQHCERHDFHATKTKG